MKPYKNLGIDESLKLWKDRLHFKQYIPTKRQKFGIKMFLLCDCKPSFILDFVIYSGAEIEIHYRDELGLSRPVVITLLERFLNKGHSLFVDNFYSSPALFEYLHRYKTGACETVRKNRVGLPNFEESVKCGD